MSVVSTMVMWGKQPVAKKEYCVEYWLKELKETMDRCTGCCDITEILLKMALNTIQSINQLIQLFFPKPLTTFLKCIRGESQKFYQ